LIKKDEIMNRDYNNPQAVTPEEEEQDGNYRLLKARRQSEAFRAQTPASSPSLTSTPPTTE
jgi:hypothetical protein